MTRDPPQHLFIVALETVHCPIPGFNLPNNATYTLQEYEKSSHEDVPSRIKNADVVIITTCCLDRTALSSETSPNLRLVLLMAAGTDCVDLEACKARGIRVINCPGANVDSVSEHAIGMYFAARRSTSLLHNAVAASAWDSPGCLLNRMRDGCDRPPLLASEETMGILGFGKIGKKIAATARALGMNVIAGGRKGASVTASVADDGITERVPFIELLRRSTVIVVILPLVPDTRNLLSATEFKTMRSDALLINLSRGGVVDESALLKSLRQGHKNEYGGIAGAAVDVFATEPASAKNNDLVMAASRAPGNQEFINLTLTPHIAWYSHRTVENYHAMTRNGLDGWLTGMPENVVV